MLIATITPTIVSNSTIKTRVKTNSNSKKESLKATS